MNRRAAVPQTRVRVPLPADETAPLVARRALRSLLGGWRLHSLVEPVLLAASELVTNAFRHGDPPLRMTVRRSAGRVSVGIADGSPRPPRQREAGVDDESGRGLAIVDQIASDSGVRDAAPGKVVWAGFDITEDV